jgi:hypothetical protein
VPAEQVEPCLPSPAKAPPGGPDWLHEIEHDGFRILALRDAKGLRLYTRNDHDFIKRFPWFDSTYRSGRSKHRLKVKNPAAPAVRREAEEDWGR